jgi:hypothetical protein
MNDNTVFRARSYDCKHKNIIYDPKNSLLDQIIYLSQHNFYILENNKVNIADNVLYIKSENIEFYNYHFIMTNNLEKYLNSNLSHAMHLPILFIIDYLRQYKKEDRHLIQQRLQNHTKIFINEQTFKDFGYNNAVLLNIGIPDNLISSYKNHTDRKNLCIFDYGHISKSIQNALQKENIECDLIDPKTPIEVLAEILNNYRVAIDPSEHYKINLLFSASCGCLGLTLDKNRSIENIIYGCSQENFLETFNKLCKIKPDISYHNQYIKDNYSIEKFILSLQEIIKNISHEAYQL